MSKFGDVLCRLRNSKRQTQKTLSKISGVSVPTISRIEQGSEPTWFVACKLADAFGVSLDDFRK